MTDRKIVLLLVLALALPVCAGEWRDRIEVALSVKDSYDFRQMALGDLVKEIAADADVNVILDSDAGGVDPTQKFSVKFNDMSYENIITWVSRSAGLEWVLQDEAIFIASRERLDEAARLQLEARGLELRARAEKTWLPGFREKLAAPHQLDFRLRPVHEAADSLELLLEINFVVSPEVPNRASVSLAVSGMSAENIIAWVARKAAIDYAVLNEAVYLAPEDEIKRLRVAGLDFSARGRPWNEVSFEYDDVPFREVIDDLSGKTGVSIVLSSAVADLPRVTLSGTEVSLMEALRSITRSTMLNSLIASEQGTVFISIQASPEERQDETQPEAWTEPPDEPGEAVPAAPAGAGY